MNFTISVQEKKLTTSLDVLEEIHLKQSRGYKLIGFIRENQCKTLTVPEGEALSTWVYMRKCIEELATKTSAPGINHFDIVTMEDNKLGWAFVLLDSFPKSDMQSFIEWEAMQTWMKGFYDFSPYGVRTLSRSDIANIVSGGDGYTDYPRYTRKSINEYRKAHFGLIEATAVELSITVAKKDEKTTYHLVGVIQINERVTEETCYYAEHLTRLLEGMWWKSKVVLIVRDDPLGTEHYGKKEKIRVGYIAVYIEDIIDIEQGKMVEAFEEHIHCIRETFYTDFIFHNRNVRLCLAGDHTLRLILKTNLINTYPNCFSDPSDEAVRQKEKSYESEMLTETVGVFSDTENKNDVKSNLNIIW